MSKLTSDGSERLTREIAAVIKADMTVELEPWIGQPWSPAFKEAMAEACLRAKKTFDE